MNILVVDDERKFADILVQRFQLRGFHSTPVYDGQSALDAVKDGEFDGIVLDLRLPDLAGAEVLRRVKTILPDIKVIVLSGHGNEQDFAQCMDLGALTCFHKPAKITDLIEAFTENDAALAEH